MRPQVNALMAELRRSAKESREAAAAELYGAEALRGRMLAAAKAGHETVTIPGPDGVDLRETKAATDAEEWLDGEKIGRKWEPRSGVAGVDAAGTFDLVLNWKVSAVSSR